MTRAMRLLLHEQNVCLNFICLDNFILGKKGESRTLKQLNFDSGGIN